METSLPAPFGPAFRTPAWWRPVADGPVPLWAHAALWLWLLSTDALLLYMASLNPRMERELGMWGGRFVLADVLGALLFYANWLVLIPQTLARGRVGWYIAAAVLAVVAYTGIRMVVPASIWGPKADNDLGVFNACFFSGIFLICFSAGLRITRDYLQAQHNRQELERQQLLTELALLRTQLNPHFLFNTLNNIYTLTTRKSDRAPEAVLRLASIMRYLLYDSRPEAVPLHQELTHLRSYLDLQRLRLPVAAAEAIAFTTEGVPDDASFLVAPLLLLPLVENAFKHGDLAARPVAVQLRLELTPAGHLRFEVVNAVTAADAARALPQEAGGVGFVNLRRRLQLLYPGRHQLRVESSATKHAVVLELHGELPFDFVATASGKELAVETVAN